MEKFEPLADREKITAAFFDRTDWLSCCATAAITLSVYLFTLAPDVTLDWSGVLATGAMYAGGQPPPGYPLWTLYAWTFTKLLPFSNIAWRVGVSSAVAGALACGLVALMVSRGGGMILEPIRGARALSETQERSLRIVSASVAGMGFGFDSAFWHQAVIVETTALGVLLFSGVLCFLLVWVHVGKTRYLYAAFFTYGLTLTVNLSMAAAALGLASVILLRKPSLGRDLFFLMTVAGGAALLAQTFDWLPEGTNAGRPLRQAYLVIGILIALVTLTAFIATRRLLTHWRAILPCVFLLVLPLSLYFYLPLASMTNPPVNWAYPRVVPGFIHLISRGQFEQIVPTTDFARFLSQFAEYAKQTTHSLGLVYIIAALIPFPFIFRMRVPERAWSLGLLATFVCLSLLLLALINPSSDRSAWEIVIPYFAPSHLVLALNAGYGVVLLGYFAGARRSLGPQH